jgi:hypothetical protein
MAVFSGGLKKFFNKKDIIIRHIIIVLMTIPFAYLSYLNAPENIPNFFIRAFLSNFIYILLMWNGNILLMDLIDGFYDITKETSKKLILAFLVAFIFPVIMHYLSNYWLFPLINGFSCSLSSRESYTYLIVSVVTTLLVNSIYMSVEFFTFWKKTLIEKEELKRTNLSAEFEALKNQVNPHFLFNSLNTLSSLIDENPKQANEFVQKLSGVYRYVLTHRDKETVLLKDEIEFIEAYIFLNKIRFGINLNTNINVNADCLGFHIPTLTIQMLVENAIKHNVISQQKPLYINISCNDKYLKVENNLQPKITQSESNGIGLNNIIERYKYLCTDEVIIIKTEEKFEVSIPLLKL